MKLPQPTTRLETRTPLDCIARVADQPGAVWLDSSLNRDGWGGRSILAFEPVGELKLTGDQGQMIDYATDPVDCDRRQIFDRLEQIRVGDNQYAIGFVSYEATLPWLGLQAARRSAILPDLHFFIYDQVARYDHARDSFDDPEFVNRFLDCPERNFETVRTKSPTAVVPIIGMTEPEYLAKITQVKAHIREGDIYQANFTCKFEATSDLDPFDTFLRLRKLNPASYGAFINFGGYQLLSSSPERLFLWDDDRHASSRITSSPIKGTIARGETQAETEANLNSLLNSAKDRAELLMIVDLVRNDLGRIATTGSVTVDSLYRPEIFSSLIHLVADISAQVRDSCSIEDVLAAMLPGGSITGAPKRRAVEIINDLEVSERSVYTGSIGCVGHGRAEFNIAIRTMIHHGNKYQIHAGGGIVADSDPKAEYQEMLLKAHNLFKAVGAV